MDSTIREHEPVLKKGVIDTAVRDVQELKRDITAIKRDMGAVVLVHNYQDPDLFDVADGTGDCIELAQTLRASGSRRAVVCGVRYVAETISMLCPEKEVILAHPQARCPMSGQIYPGRVRRWREESPDTCVVCSVQFNAHVKAECDLCVTNNNALEVLRKSGARKMLLLADGNFGDWLCGQLPEKEIELWRCSCPAMNNAQAVDVELCRTKWQNALVAANGAMKPGVTALADMTGSTAQIMEFCAAAEQDVIVADEVSVCSLLRRRYPEKGIWQLAPTKLICSNMKLTGLEVLERALKGEFGVRVAVEPDVAEKALVPLRRMLNLAGVHDFD